MQDNPNFESETCGICMDAVIDRGVLDCCQHWYALKCLSLCVYVGERERFEQVFIFIMKVFCCYLELFPLPFYY